MAETYWDRRQQEADAKLAADEARIDAKAARFYSDELKRLDAEIATYYARWGVDGVVQYRTMLQTMDPADRDLLMRDCDAFAAQHPELAKYVDIRKEAYKLDRLEGLQASARLHLFKATQGATEGLADHFGKAAADAANAVRDTMGYGKNFYSYDDDMLRKLVGRKWVGGQAYPERIWGSADRLAEYVNNDLSAAFVRGDSYDRIVRDMSHRFKDVAVSNISRLVQTEGTYVARAAQAEEFRSQGVDEYQIETQHDDRVCPTCVGAARGTYLFSDMRVGENYPPLHARCRCVVNPYVSDWDAWLDRQADREAARLKAKRMGAPGEATR